jgi:hypothetical protein
MFNRKGKCPICYKTFQSKQCPHTYDYVIKVLDLAKNNLSLERDVKKVRNRIKY